MHNGQRTGVWLSHCKCFWHKNTSERQKARIREGVTRMTYETIGDMATGRGNYDFKYWKTDVRKRQNVKSSDSVGGCIGLRQCAPSVHDCSSLINPQVLFDYLSCCSTNRVGLERIRNVCHRHPSTVTFPPQSWLLFYRVMISSLWRAATARITNRDVIKKFEVIAAVNIKFTFFYSVTQCTLIDNHKSC